MDIATLLTSSVEDLVKPIFDGSWVEQNAEEQAVTIELFVTLHKFVGSMRQSFDDTLTTEQAKGNLHDVEHIRKPRERKNDAPASMADFLKKLTK